MKHEGQSCVSELFKTELSFLQFLGETPYTLLKAREKWS